MRKMPNLKKKLENLKIERNQRLKDEVHTSNDIEYLEIVARDKLNLQLLLARSYSEFKDNITVSKEISTISLFKVCLITKITNFSLQMSIK